MPAVLACDRYMEMWIKHRDASADDRAPRTQVDELHKRLSEQQVDAVERLRPIVVAGLQSREGRTLRPLAVLPEPHTKDLMADMQAWSIVESCLAALGARVRGLCVCRSCTMVFRPKRKRVAARCPLCEHHDAAPPLGTVLPAGVKLGENWRPGQSVKVPVPKWNDAGELQAWGVTSIGISSEAKLKRRKDGRLDYDHDDVFIGRSNKKGSPADRKRRSRRS
jgi:hypothetical protein